MTTRRITFEATCVCDAPTTFSVVCVYKGTEEELAQLKNGGVVLRSETGVSYWPGDKVKINIDWPYESFTPFDVTWSPFPTHARRWKIDSAKWGDEELMQRGGLF